MPSSAPPAGSHDSARFDSADCWDVLDQFIQELQNPERSSRQFHLLLEAICESLRADAAFLYSPLSDEKIEVVGRNAPAPAWCRAFTEHLLRELPDEATQLLRSDLGALAGLPPPLPHSVAMVQVSKSRKVWAVALSFAPKRTFRRGDVKVMLLARRMLSYHYQQLYSSEELKNALLGLVHCLTASLDAKDPYTSGHSERVARIAVRIGQQMQLPEGMLSDFFLAGLFHDIGKIGVRDSVLQKPGRLTPEEVQHVQEHAVIGDRIISNVKQLAHIRPGVRNHHERYDGNGYPDRLAGQDIPLMARILAVADACDAMMSPRPYREAIATSQIETIMVKGAGRQWDPEIIEHFMVCRGELFSICQRGIGESVCIAVEHAVRAGKRPSWTVPLPWAVPPSSSDPRSGTNLVGAETSVVGSAAGTSLG